MNKPDTLAEEHELVFKDLLRFFRATARRDQNNARRAATILEETLGTLLEQMRQTRGGS